MLSFAIKKINMNIREPRSKHTNIFQNKVCASVQTQFERDKSVSLI